MSLDHKTSHNGQFLRIFDLFIIWRLYKSAFHWCMVWTINGIYAIFGWDITDWKSGIWGCKKNWNIEKITFKLVQLKSLATHITNQNLSFDIFTVGNLQKTAWNMVHGIAMCFWLLLQIYPSDLRLVLWSRDTYCLWSHRLQAYGY